MIKTTSSFFSRFSPAAPRLLRGGIIPGCAMYACLVRRSIFSPGAFDVDWNGEMMSDVKDMTLTEFVNDMWMIFVLSHIPFGSRFDSRHHLAHQLTHHLTPEVVDTAPSAAAANNAWPGRFFLAVSAADWSSRGAKNLRKRNLGNKWCKKRMGRNDWPFNSWCTKKYWRKILEVLVLKELANCRCRLSRSAQICFHKISFSRCSMSCCHLHVVPPSDGSL